ncbi:MAG: CoA ester lyase [Gemmatimonadota bacterium]|nr:CoA ester lyase [Gemmatimonadota bacterium]MDE2986189.1 CoA ester lyase [Gemmatimonadota bacterium]
MNLPTFRSILFVPGDRPDRYEKALAADADAVCIDLEDAVAEARKAEAREAVMGFLQGSRSGDSPRRPCLVVRINDPATDAGCYDLRAIADGPQPDAVMVPMVRRAVEVAAALEKTGIRLPVLPLIETAGGLDNAVGIGAVTGVEGLVFGGFDLALELGADPVWEPLLYARSRVVHAAAMNRVPAYDMPSRDFREMSVLREEARRTRSLGFAGKTAIHPAQIPVIHEVYAPSREEVERALAIVEADRGAEGGAVGVAGRMVDRPVVEAARRVLERAGKAGRVDGEPDGAGG